MNLNDIPEPTTAERINAAFDAILHGDFDAPEVLDVLWGRVGSTADYWALRGARSIEMDVARALDEIRVGAAAIRAALNKRFDDIAAQVVRP